MARKEFSLKLRKTFAGTTLQQFLAVIQQGGELMQSAIQF
jgi:hypothetical protein